MSSVLICDSKLLGLWLAPLGLCNTPSTLGGGGRRMHQSLTLTGHGFISLKKKIKKRRQQEFLGLLYISVIKVSQNRENSWCPKVAKNLNDQVLIQTRTLPLAKAGHGIFLLCDDDM